LGFSRLNAKQNLPGYKQQENKKMSSNLVCNCFGYTADDIKKDYMANGHSLIMAYIMSKKKNAECNCESNNPQGR